MKINLLYSLLALLCFFISCTSDKEGDLNVDCTLSDLTLTLDSKSDPGCTAPGIISVTATGGEGALSYTLDGVFKQASGTFDGVAAGTHTIVVTDSNDCTEEIEVQLTASSGGVSATLNATASGCGSQNGTITVSASGGSGTYSYTLGSGTAVSTNEFTGLGAGNYQVAVTDTGDGCSTTVSVSIANGTSLATDIMPIINANCTANSSCHVANSGRQVFQNSPANVVSNAAGIKSRTGTKNMPQIGSLTNQEIALIACWVDDGALNN